MKRSEDGGQMPQPKWIFRNTASQVGFRQIIHERNSPLRLLRYDRLILRGRRRSYALTTESREFGVFCVAGEGRVEVRDQAFHMGSLDGVYLPPGVDAEVSARAQADLVIGSAPGDGLQFPPAHVPIAQVRGNRTYHWELGDAKRGDRRDGFMVLGDQIQAARLYMGYTRGWSGQWTSWPPHEHAAQMEEIYVFFDMPAPARALQCLFLKDPSAPGAIQVVRQGDAVAAHRGYHPNGGFPGTEICFVWIMAAKKRGGRRWVRPNIHPDYATPPCSLRPRRGA
jgi:5-deoxy-glucuronate isomerase